MRGSLSLTVDEATYRSLGLVCKRSNRKVSKGMGRGKGSPTHFTITADLTEPSFVPGRKGWDRWNWCLSNRIRPITLLASWIVDGVAKPISPLNSQQKIELSHAGPDSCFPTLLTPSASSISTLSCPSVNLPHNIPETLANFSLRPDSIRCISDYCEELMEWTTSIATGTPADLEIDPLMTSLSTNQQKILPNFEVESATRICESTSVNAILPSVAIPSLVDVVREAMKTANPIGTDRTSSAMPIPFVCLLLWVTAVPSQEARQWVLFVLPEDRIVLVGSHGKCHVFLKN